MPKPYTPNDKWSQKAAAEGYRARSVYKLQELDEKFRLLKPGMHILDIGAAPGSWLQYVSEHIGPKGKALGLDLQEIEPIEQNICTKIADVFNEELVDQLICSYFTSSDKPKLDIVLSDMAPKTSGIADIDQWKSIELTQELVAIAKRYLKPRGYCVAKVLRGADFDAFVRELEEDWKYVKVVQVKASRDRSREVFIVLCNT